MLSDFFQKSRLTEKFYKTDDEQEQYNNGNKSPHWFTRYYYRYYYYCCYYYCCCYSNQSYSTHSQPSNCSLLPFLNPLNSTQDQYGLLFRHQTVNNWHQRNCQRFFPQTPRHPQQKNKAKSVGIAHICYRLDSRNPK
ncbi:hypothetical protein THIOM_002296 [Candidatus Thiomargarita nelsonii]|uniref:Uncharacterized protein n=1 Tax=Candidatus Thiomargarita nelsonii TaxID=1003181 RepID=A0A176S1U6_9GAMM|nr:hypothetical protein THIOM_002296 [Candidatus Thiomargarita nelsonii]